MLVGRDRLEVYLPSPSKSIVFEMSLAFQDLSVLVFAQNIFTKRHVSAAKRLEEGFDALFILHHVISQIVDVDIDADRAHDTELLAINGDGCAFEFPRPDIEFVIEFIFILNLALLEIDQQLVVPSCRCRPVTLFSSAINECDGSARLCNKISIPESGNDFPMRRTMRA